MEARTLHEKTTTMKVKITFDDGLEIGMENVAEIDEITPALEYFGADGKTILSRELSKFELEYMKSLHVAFVFYESDIMDEQEYAEAEAARISEDENA